MKTLRWASLALLLAGCGPNRVVHMGFVLPSLLERFGRRMTVADFEGPMGTEISDRIRSQVGSSGVFEVVPIDRADMAVSGALLESRILPERMETIPHSCTRIVVNVVMQQVCTTRPAPYTPPNPNGTYTPPPPPQQVCNTIPVPVPTPQSYPCTRLMRSVDVTARIAFRVRARARNAVRTAVTREYSRSDHEQTEGLQGSDSDDRQPAPIDAIGLQRRLHESIVADIIAEVLPRPRNVSVEFADCREPRCDQVLEVVRARNYAGADALLSAVIDANATPTTEEQRVRLAGGLFNRGVLRGYGDRPEDGLADLVRAIELRPAEGAWVTHRTAIEARLRQIAASRPAPTRAAPRRPRGAH